MVSRDEMARLAVWDTALSRAMRRALGLPALAFARNPGRHRDHGAFSGMADCFKNHESPMDGRYASI